MTALGESLGSRLSSYCLEDQPHQHCSMYMESSMVWCGPGPKLADLGSDQMMKRNNPAAAVRMLMAKLASSG